MPDAKLQGRRHRGVCAGSGRLYAPICHFDRLSVDPFEFLNQNTNEVHGFIYKTYAPTESERMYFTPENAARIDYFTSQIEEWNRDGLLTESEYMFLLANLIEYDTFSYIVYMKKTIQRFGLERRDKDAYLRARDYYNSLPENKRDPRLLLV